MFTNLSTKKGGINRGNVWIPPDQRELGVSFSFHSMSFVFLTACLISLLTDMSMVQIKFIIHLGCLVLYACMKLNLTTYVWRFRSIVD